MQCRKCTDDHLRLDQRLLSRSFDRCWVLQYSESGAQNSGPKQYPKRNKVVTRFATRRLTPKCSDMLPIQPVGLDEAKVALVTRMIAAAVMYLRVLKYSFVVEIVCKCWITIFEQCSTT